MLLQAKRHWQREEQHVAQLYEMVSQKADTVKACSESAASYCRDAERYSNQASDSLDASRATRNAFVSLSRTRDAINYAGLAHGSAVEATCESSMANTAAADAHNFAKVCSHRYTLGITQALSRVDW